MKPSEAVWQKVETRIQKDKKRKALIWWWVMGIAMAGAGFQLLYRFENDQQTISASTAKNSSDKRKFDFKDENCTQ